MVTDTHSNTEGPASSAPLSSALVQRENGRLHEFPRHLAAAAGNETPGLADFLYGPRKLLSHPSPVAGGMPPAVTMLPSEEVQALRQTIVARYLKQIRRAHVTRFVAKLRKRRVAPLSDADYMEFLTRTACARLMMGELTERDRQRFGVAWNDPSRYYKFDFSRIGDITPIEGVYLCANMALVRKDQTGCLQPAAILLNDRLVRPGDGDRWEMAKYFVVSSGANLVLLSEHPMVHFPMDAVNAAAKSIFPRGHVVHKLLLPHSHLQLPLNYAVLYQQRSVLHNRQHEIYSLFPHRELSRVYQMIAERYSGAAAPGDCSGRYRYPLGERPEFSEYDRFLNEYFRVILGFVRRVVATVEPGDSFVRQWAQVLAPIVHGFPDERAIAQTDNLARAVAGFIWNCSVAHSLDHYTIGRFPVEKMPLRLRTPPPGAGPFQLDRRNISLPGDIINQRLGCEMYFKPHTLTRLADVDYRFDTQELSALNRDFLGALRWLDQAMPNRLMPLQQIAASIQY